MQLQHNKVQYTAVQYSTSLLRQLKHIGQFLAWGFKFTDGSGAGSASISAQIQVVHEGGGALSIFPPLEGNRERPLSFTLKLHDARLLSSDLAAAGRVVLRQTSKQVMRPKADKTCMNQLVGIWPDTSNPLRHPTCSVRRSLAAAAL